jgi:hypothetical protein
MGPGTPGPFHSCLLDPPDAAALPWFTHPRFPEDLKSLATVEQPVCGEVVRYGVGAR